MERLMMRTHAAGSDEREFSAALLDFIESCTPGEFREMIMSTQPRPHGDVSDIAHLRQTMIADMRRGRAQDRGSRPNTTRNPFDNGLGPSRHLPTNLFGTPAVDRTNALLNESNALGGDRSLQGYYDAINMFENMSLEDMRDYALSEALMEAEDSDDEAATTELFERYNDQQLEALRQRQLEQMKRYYGPGGRGEIPGVQHSPAVRNNSRSDSQDYSRSVHTAADFDRMFRELETCPVERFRELAIHLDIDDGFVLDHDQLTDRYRGYTHGQLERIRQRTVQGLRSYRPGGPGPALGVSRDVRNIPFLEQDDAAFRRKVIEARSKSGRKPRFITAEEAKETAPERVDSIFSGWNALHSILERHEAVIQKRWMKKTKTQKQKVILAAWPGMSANHRPDFDAARRASSGNRSVQKTTHKDAFMWPDMNQEDLLRPRTLLILLNAKGRNSPCAFWKLDIDACHVGYTISAIEEPYLNRHTMLFKDRTTAETFGELRSFDNTHEGMELMAGFKGLPVGSGLVVLEIQKRIMRFLVDCCKDILHDMPPATLLDAEVQPEPKISAPTTNGFTSLAEMRSEAPYRLPEAVGLPRLRAIFNAKRSAAEDHIWSLREDSSYFVETLKDAMDHRYQHVKDTQGRSHPSVQPTRDHLVWGPVISNVVASADYYLEIWSKLCEMIDDNEEILTKRDPREEMPEDVKMELAYFKAFLQHALRGPLAQLKAGLHSSPPLRPSFERRIEDDERARRTGVYPLWPKSSSRLTRGQGGPEEDLIWLMKLLVEDGMDTPETKAKDLVSPHIANVFSDLSVLTEALRQLDVYKGKLPEAPLIGMRDDNGKVIKSLTVPWINMQKEIEGDKPLEFYKLGSPAEGRFHYPVDKRRTKENHEAMQAAERNLDAFWGQIDRNFEVKRQWHLDHLKECEKCCNCGVETAVRKLLSGSRYLQRTGDWVEPNNNEQTAAKQSRVDEAARRPLSELYFDLEHRTQRTISPDHKHSHGHSHQHHDHGHDHGKEYRAKTKTRGMNPSPENVQPAAPADHPAPSAQPDDQPTFTLDARALKVFRTLFFTPSISSTPGEVPWTDFLHAMAATGFAPEKLYGSVWNFRPSGLDVERSIQIHEPHPSGKIPYRHYRRHGRRLDKAYDWHGGMFVLAEKGKGPLRETEQ
ncbi:hypothetical protein LTR85_000480 [Meristemomyces frigidus]|nr:hypothetical protein LTR85_000480 [Meristemomyces frigidus]